jgi:hypothetical protein
LAQSSHLFSMDSRSERLSGFHQPVEFWIPAAKADQAFLRGISPRPSEPRTFRSGPYQYFPGKTRAAAARLIAERQVSD